MASWSEIVILYGKGSVFPLFFKEFHKKDMFLSVGCIRNLERSA